MAYFMRVARLVLEWFGILFSGGLSVGLFGLGLVGKLAGAANFRLEMVPWWSGGELINMLLWGGLFGIAATALAVSGKFRWPLVAWALALLVCMVWGFLASNYKYDGMEPFKDSLKLILAQLASFIGSLSQALKKR
jgi:hypothetical protein